MLKWTQDDFDSISWHDNHVHGLRFFEGEHGTGELEFDLDYILEWLTPVAGAVSYRYRVAPARLRFRDVTNLAISIDYASISVLWDPSRSTALNDAWSSADTARQYVGGFP
jgi:hypothetical protein